MSEPFVFDPRCTLRKDPFGAAVCGPARHLFLPPPPAGGIHPLRGGAAPGVFRDAPGGGALPGEAQGERALFTAPVEMPEAPELIWYHFRFWRDDGTGLRPG